MIKLLKCFFGKHDFKHFISLGFFEPKVLMKQITYDTFHPENVSICMNCGRIKGYVPAIDVRLVKDSEGREAWKVSD